MIVSAWTDGHGGYGFRILSSDIGLFFRPEWREVTLNLPDEGLPAVVTITESFWESSPELRDRTIKNFLLRNGLVPWPKNHPPHFDLEPLGGGEFRLNWIERVERQPLLLLDR